MRPRFHLYLLSLVWSTGPVLAASPELPLDVAIASALEHNVGLRIASYEPADALDTVEIEDAQFDPSFFASTALQEGESVPVAGASSESDGRSARIGIDQRWSTGATVTLDSALDRSGGSSSVLNPDYGADVGISLSQPLLKGAGTTVNLAPLARAKVNAERSLFDLRSEVLDLVLETEIAYWNLAYARADRALTVSSLALAENLREENSERERLGLVTPLEVLQAEAEVLNQQEAIIQADNNIEDAEDALRRAIGQTDFVQSVSDTIVVCALPEKMQPLRSIDEVVQDTLLNDIDAQVQERRIEVERINRMLAQDELQPDLDLSGGLSYLGRDDSGSRAYSGVYSADGYAWSLGLELRVPWGLREARARERQAGRSVEQATLQLYDIKQAKALAARNAWRSASSGLKRIEVTRAAMRLNQEAFEQERARYGSGLVAYRSVLEAQRDYDRAKSNYLGSLIETLRAIVRLSRIDGTLLQRNGLNWDAVAPYTELTTPRAELNTSRESNTP